MTWTHPEFLWIVGDAMNRRQLPKQRFDVHLRTIVVFNEKPIRDGYKYTMTEYWN